MWYRRSSPSPITTKSMFSCSIICKGKDDACGPPRTVIAFGHACLTLPATSMAPWICQENMFDMATTSGSNSRITRLTSSQVSPKTLVPFGYSLIFAASLPS